MVNLYVFEKSTGKVVAIIQGPDGVSCEHAAGHVDEQGKQPYCSESLGWVFNVDTERSGLVGIETAPIVEAHKFDPSLPAGTPGGPHRMTQEQFDDQLLRQRAEQKKLAEQHGLKVKA